MPIVTPLPPFTALSEAEVLQALEDSDPGNPIAGEVARLITGYAENFRAHTERLGRIPFSLLLATPETAIEAVAMRLTTEAIRAEITDPHGNA